ncbi:DUF3566 domain-containing protein [Solwaraspora sp. WMMD792]|uniref:DUF3566 domain-containing protein n=1 Tax=Solwaraspora sp. WMMD792 TaxID=3016099 RepID=UPI002415999F|nr:DUF3566 domain-containing protein [Solwaraspora sp. WMMD792]MDG4774080.1 DUF3566 domain-containing protein [Solwaraspora sp. WMMD792]
MTETQAKSGGTGSSAAPVDEESAAGGTSTATGRAAVGRASVPGDSPSPKFTRAPGMPPPPDRPADDSAGGTGDSADGSTRAGGTGDSATQLGGISASSGRSAPPVTSAPPVSSAPPASSGSGFTGGALGATAASGTRPGGGLGPTGQFGTIGGTARVGTATPGSRTGLGSPTVRTIGGAGAGAGVGAVGAARVGPDGARTARPGVSSAASRGPRRARLNLKRIDPWSVMKFSFAVSLVLFIVVIVATSVLYLALDAMGVFQSVNASLGDLIGTGAGDGPSLRITAQGVIGTAALFGLINVVLYTALATLGAFIYNVCADLVGGIELTLAERD